MVNSDTIYHSDDKKISTTSVTFGLLRKELISNLGMKRAKAFLLRYGWNIGIEYAKKVLQNPTNLEDMLSKGDSLSLQTGQILKMISKRTLNINDDGQVDYLFATGKWIDSFEVKEHLKSYGLSNYPVCHTLVGLCSGFASMITKRKVFFKEVKCRAMGHDECCYEMRLEEEWQNDSEMLEEISLYQKRSFLDELNSTYEHLLLQKNSIEKISTFHDTLTNITFEGLSIEELVRTVSQTLEIPVTIEDLNFHTSVYVGIEQNTHNILKEDLLNFLSRTSCGSIQSTSYDKSRIIRGKLHNRLITPIVVQNQPIGYLTFIYTDRSIEIEKDIMFLQRAANSVANYSLAKKARINRLDKLEGYFLEQLLLKQYPSESDMINHGQNLGIDLKKAFYIASLQFSSDVQLDIYDSEFSKQVISLIKRYLDIYSDPILVTQFDNQIVMLIPKVKELHFKLENILNYLNDRFKHGIFRIGLSNESESIDNIFESLEESQLVLRIKKQEPIAFFEDTNMIGTLINAKNMSTIRLKAQKELQPILQLKEGKRDELLKTMYVFLLNGGNLQQSINDLSLSMSGLMYRISKIEKLLDKQLRNPRAAYELLLMLDALKFLGDIDV